MLDKVSLRIDGLDVENFLSYSVEADLYKAADAFSMELADTGVEIKTGMRCELRVNDQLELTGIVDKVIHNNESGRKDKLTVEGRDLMGLLVDSYCEEFKDFENVTLKFLAEQLLKNVPFINREKIIYQEDKKDKKEQKKESDHIKVDPGQTVFDVLKDYAASKGLFFYSMPDGTFVFGAPKMGGEPKYELFRRKDGRGNNIISSKVTDDITKRYSKVTVMGQRQAPDWSDISVSVPDKEDEGKEKYKFPFYKPFVVFDGNIGDEEDAKRQAKNLIKQKRLEGITLLYRVAGHAYNGVNWAINEFCQVVDDVAGVNGPYLITKRTFKLSRQGAFTELELGLPGKFQLELGLSGRFQSSAS